MINDVIGARETSSAVWRARRGVAGTVIGLTILAAGGCGSPQQLSRGEYIRKVDELERVAGRETASPQDQGPATAVSELDQKREVLEELSRGLAGLEPPEEIRRAHELAISGLRDLAAQLRPLARALREGDVQTAQRLAGAFRRSQGARDLERAGQLLRAERYPPIDIPDPQANQGG